MNNGLEIKITVFGGEKGAGGVRMDTSTSAPAPLEAFGGDMGTGDAAPSPLEALGGDMGTGDAAPSPLEALGGDMGTGDAAPSPLDALGAGQHGNGSTPSPATGSAGARAELPEPVPLDQIEQLASSSGTAPAPEDDKK